MLGLGRKHGSAATAKERLQIVVSHQRQEGRSPDYLKNLQSEILQVISKYVAIDREQINFNFQSEENISTLELNVTLPNSES